MPPDRLKRGQGARAHRVLARIGVRIYWCDYCNLPLLTRVCGLCRHEGRLVKITPPADARPALGVDYVQIWELIRSEIGAVPYPRRRIVLLNKIPYPDVAEEVVIDGHLVGHRYFDVLERKWRFKPLYVGVSELLRRKAGSYAIVDLHVLARNYEIHKDKIIEASLPSKGEKQFIAIATPSNFEGVGVLTERGRIRVLKSWKAKQYRWNDANPTWLDAVKANESHLSILEQEAVDFLRELASRTGLKPVVSFSGGKDSLVTYRLAEKAFGKVPLLFNDTGLELPETVNYVKNFARQAGTELILAEAGRAFWDALDVMGPPARDYRWCCKVCKLVPTAYALRKCFEGEVLSIVGQRRLESAARALSPRVYRNKWIPSALVAAPIHDWTTLGVWLYLFKEKLPLNKLYFKGFDRLGCWLCPAIELGEVEQLKSVKPELWESWERILYEYAAVNGYGDDWVKLGLWRWIDSPGDIRRLLVRGAQARRVLPVAIEQEGGAIILQVKRIKKDFDKETFAGVLSTVGEVDCTQTYYVLDGVPIELAQEQDRYVVKVHGKREDVWKTVSAVVRSFLCLNCKSCEIWCPVGAVRVESLGPRVDTTKCVKCGKCNSVCPLSEYLLRLLRNATLARGL